MSEAGAPGETQIGSGSLPLRLRAEDGEDLAVISACLQDALVAVHDLAYDPGARVFLLVANRFRWERCRPGGGTLAAGPFERTLCGVTFDNITGAAYRGFYRGEKDRILSLLAIRLAVAGGNVSPGLAIHLDFPGHAQIRRPAAALRRPPRGFGEPWPASRQPGQEFPMP